MSLYLGLLPVVAPGLARPVAGVSARPAEHLADYARVFNSSGGQHHLLRLCRPLGDGAGAGPMWSPTTFASASSFPKEISHQERSR